MKRPLLIIAALWVCRFALAQGEAVATDTVSSEPIESAQLKGAREATEAEKEYARLLAEERREQQQIDQNLPVIDENGQVIAGTDRFYPYMSRYGARHFYSYLDSWLPSWELHKGLNVNVGTSVFANFGGHGHHGAGFTQDISLMYVANLSKKATLAVGGYFNNMLYQGTNYTTAGISAILGYQFDEHWSGYAFVQKAFNSDSYARLGSPYSPYWGGYGFYGAPGYGYPMMGMGYGNGLASRNMDRIGAGLRYEWGNHNYIQIQVEVDHVPNGNSGFGYDYRRYDYPTF